MNRAKLTQEERDEGTEYQEEQAFGEMLGKMADQKSDWLAKLLPKLNEETKLIALGNRQISPTARSKAWHDVTPVTDPIINLLLQEEPRLWAAMTSNKALTPPQAERIVDALLANKSKPEYGTVLKNGVSQLVPRIISDWTHPMAQKLYRVVKEDDKSLEGQLPDQRPIQNKAPLWKRAIVQILAEVPNTPAQFFIEQYDIAHDPETFAALLNIDSVELKDIAEVAKLWQNGPSAYLSFNKSEKAKVWASLFYYWDKEHSKERPKWLDKLHVNCVAQGLFYHWLVKPEWLDWLNDTHLNGIMSGLDVYLYPRGESLAASLIEKLSDETWTRLEKATIAKLLGAPHKKVRQITIGRAGRLGIKKSETKTGPSL